MTSLDEYHKDLMADVRREADASGVLMVEAFFDRMTERLTEAGELEVVDRAFYQNGEGALKLRIDGYGGDPRDCEGTLGLIICDFVDSDEIKTLAKNELAPLLNPLIRFLQKARKEEFRDGLNEVSPAFQVSDLIISTWSQVSKIKLILISNRRYTSRDDAVKLKNVGDISVTYSVWDLSRFERFDSSGRAREDLVIDFRKDFGGALPALKASQEDAALESYLMIIPGQQLAEIYDKWGARLLEANVRSFLQARAKTNKGIQATIRTEPQLFFPYNNGLSATADAVTCIQTPQGLAVASINNLQIVNGAQTTGSIHASLKTATEQLRHVFVQMKLTVVPSDRSEEIVPKISEYANTQNKVNVADFFSNHPFHVRMELFSRNVLFSRREGERHDSKWFYERSRGQYINARSKLTVAQQKKFDLEFPKTQLFNKTDLAKFEVSARGHPHLVSGGAQKNFAEFAREIGESYSKNDAQYDELWFKRLIAKALIFRRLETEIPRQPWYEGGYRANIVTYAMAKIFNDAESSKQTLDLDTIWRRQAVSQPLLRALLIAAAEAHVAITHPPQGIRNMSEWAKKQACWSDFKSRKLAYDRDFVSCLTLVEASRATTREARNDRLVTDGINAQTEAVNLGADFWQHLIEWGRTRGLLTPIELAVLQICTFLPRRVPTDLQSKKALAALSRMKDLGYGQE